MDRHNSPTQQRLLAALAASAVPDAIRDAMHAPVTAAPAAGDIWRAVWDANVLLLLVLDYRPGTVKAAPVVLDVDDVDEEALIVDAALSGLKLAFAVWLGLERTLPERVLERKITATALHVDTPGWDSTLIAEGRARRGRTVTSVLEAAAENRAVVEDKLEAFEHARWIEASSGGLGKMIKDSGIPVKQVAALLQVDLPRALAVIRGQVPVIAEQAESLAPALGLDSQRILAANPAPPAELAAYLDQPQWRAQVRRLAQQNDQSETRAWYDAAFGTWGLAARQTGGTSQPPAWEERLKRFFAMSLRGTA